MRPKKSYKIFVNDTELFFTIAGSKTAIQRYLKMYLKDTHMGQLYKTPKGYNYDTTIGKYYRFERTSID